MRILVTGANGFLGRGICKELYEAGHEVVAADSKVEGLPDKVLHLAWRNGFEHNASSHLEELIHHINFLTKCLSSGINKIAVMGTMHEVGFFEGPISENTPCKPLNYYGVAKNSLRDYLTILCKEYSAEMQWISAFYIVDNTSFGSSIFSKISQAVEMGKPTFPFNSGKNLYDFLDFSEFCFRVGKVVSQGEVNGIINVCSGEPVRLSERVTRYIEENKFTIKLEYGKFPDRDYDSKAIWGNVEKLNLILENDRLSERGD